VLAGRSRGISGAGRQPDLGIVADHHGGCSNTLFRIRRATGKAVAGRFFRGGGWS